MEHEAQAKPQRVQWIELSAILLSLCGAFIAVSGAAGVYASQVQTFNPPMWPLPGLILVYWACLGLANLAFTILIARSKSDKYLRAMWAINGAFIPMIIVGAFSIGPIILIGFVFFVLSATISTIRNKARLVNSLGFVLLGIFINAGIMLAIIFLFTPIPFAKH